MNDELCVNAEYKFFWRERQNYYETPVVSLSFAATILLTGFIAETGAKRPQTINDELLFMKYNGLFDQDIAG